MCYKILAGVAVEPVAVPDAAPVELAVRKTPNALEKFALVAHLHTFHVDSDVGRIEH